MYTIPAKPTKYKGRLYRSRLEARWAAFFDLLQWDYEYEPFDLNGWSPDFIIKGNIEVLVEVKPSLLYFETRKYMEAINKVEDGMLIFNSDVDTSYFPNIITIPSSNSKKGFDVYKDYNGVDRTYSPDFFIA